MKDISLHILDIVQNSIVAKAQLIEIAIVDSKKENIYNVTIKDNGKGIEPEMLKTVTDPWTTSRTTRKVGMGIPLFKQNAELTGGNFLIESVVGEGTELTASFVNDNIDRIPAGDLVGVYSMLLTANPDLEFVLSHKTDKDIYIFDTREVKEILGDTPLNNPDVRNYLKEMIAENIQELYS